MRAAQRLYTAVTEQAACPQFLSGGEGSLVGMGWRAAGLGEAVNLQSVCCRARRLVRAAATQPSVRKLSLGSPANTMPLLTCDSHVPAARSHGHPLRLPADPLLALPPHLAAAGAAAGGRQGRQAAGTGKRCRKQQHEAAAACDCRQRAGLGRPLDPCKRHTHQCAGSFLRVIVTEKECPPCLSATDAV